MSSRGSLPGGHWESTALGWGGGRPLLRTWEGSSAAHRRYLPGFGSLGKHCQMRKQQIQHTRQVSFVLPNGRISHHNCKPFSGGLAHIWVARKNTGARTERVCWAGWRGAETRETKESKEGPSTAQELGGRETQADPLDLVRLNVTHPLVLGVSEGLGVPSTLPPTSIPLVIRWPQFADDSTAHRSVPASGENIEEASLEHIVGGGLP